MTVWIILPSFSLPHELRVIAPFLSLLFLVNKHRPPICTSKIVNFFSAPHSFHLWILPSPSIHTPVPPPRHHLLLSPSLCPTHLPGLPFPFCRTSGRYGVCRTACMHLNEILHFVPVLLPSALILTFTLFPPVTHSCTLFWVRLHCR